MAKQVLKVAGITQRFGGLAALQNINMEVFAQENVGVIGPNGAGKTTLFNVITGIYTPTEGTVVINGQESTGRKPHEIVQMGFARTFQNIRLFSRMTVMENVMMAMHCRTTANVFSILINTRKKKAEDKKTKEEAERLLKMMNLYEKRFDFPSSLPYGAQRKLEIARALATQPELLLLDEPAAGMNEQETQELLQIVRQLKDAGYTILLIEHDMKFVMNICERIYVLDHGELIAEGTPVEIGNNERVIEAYLGKDVD